ncbi:MAG: isoaspartyl peptidase/L-asparaginase [Cyclobacteriaceae bacterium]
MAEAKIILHGGFFSEADTTDAIKKAKQQALADIAIKGYEFLQHHSTLDTVVFTTELLEDCELFNAGTGSQIQRDGKIRMSASLMDGVSLKFSGVINIEDVKNPIRVAEHLISGEDRVLAGEGALQYARAQGFEFFKTETTHRRQEFEAKKGSAGLGTVGCVALDQNGNLAAATSTGGKGFEMPGRVSDSATVAGNFANAVCGVSCTGVGEDIVSGAVAVKIVTRVTDGLSLREACEKTFAELRPLDGFAGAIAIDKAGNLFYIDSHPRMVFALYDGNKLIVFD